MTNQIIEEDTIKVECVGNLEPGDMFRSAAMVGVWMIIKQQISNDNDVMVVDLSDGEVRSILKSAKLESRVSRAVIQKMFVI